MKNHPILQRITLDLDHVDEWELLKTVDTIRQMDLEPEIFRTKNGYHIVAYFPPGREWTFWELVNLRHELGDDPRRIQHDISRMGLGHPVDVLFRIRRGESNRYLVTR